MRLLITGCAGFIGYHLAKKLLKNSYDVIGVDNLNSYYDVNLKQARLTQLKQYSNFKFYQADICYSEIIHDIFASEQPQLVVHLAAQAGVRYSLENPNIYVQSNLVGFGNIIEVCRQFSVAHLVYASTSSVYGANGMQPSQEIQPTNHPLTLYAATKKANELMAHSYSHLYGLPTTGLRFFTVYGPWGRPDMAFFSFTRDILAGNPIKIYNQGNMRRDFTYIDDIVEGIYRVIRKPASENKQWSNISPDPSTSNVPYRIYNIGCGNSINLMDYIEELERALGKKAVKLYLPIQAGDVVITQADMERFQNDFDYLPKIGIREGIQYFVEWYQRFYHDVPNVCK